MLIKYESLKDYESEIFYKNFKSINSCNYDSISNNFLEKPVLISYHNIGKNNLKHVLFTEKENVIKLKNETLEDSISYNGFIIKKLKKINKLYYYTEKTTFYPFSNEKLLIENSLRNSNHISSSIESDSEKCTNIDLLYSLLSDELKKHIDIPELLDFYNISHISDWIQFDVDFNQNQLTLHGLLFKNDSIPRKINKISDIEPTITGITQIVPNNFIEFERYAYDHSKYLKNLESTNSIDKIELIKNDSLFYDILEIGSIVLNKDSILTFNFNNKNLLNLKIQQNTESSYNYRSNKIYKLSQSLFNPNTSVKNQMQNQII